MFLVVLIVNCNTSGQFNSNSSGSDQNSSSQVSYKLSNGEYPTMGLDELTSLLKEAKSKGQALKGYGKSVFSGTKPEKFDIEIIDIIHDFVGEGYDTIFFRFSSPYIEREDSSIVMGMSGSPLYVNDKIVGALAYGWLWGRVNNRVGYATPIEYMLQELETKTIKSTTLPSYSRTNSDSKENLTTFMPMMISCAMNEQTQQLIDFANKHFPSNPFKNFKFIGSGSGSPVYSDMAPQPIEPGSVLGVEFIGGDISMAGLGTATYVKGDKVLAFGHPMYGQGSKYKFPITTGHVSGIIALFPACWKQGSANVDLGTLEFDGQASINGTIGKIAPRINTTVSITNKMTGQVKNTSFRLAKVRDFAPILSWYAAQLPLLTMLVKTEKPTVLKATIEGTLDDNTPFSFVYEELPGRWGIYWQRPLYDNIERITTNKFDENINLQTLKINLELTQELPSACLSSVWADKSKVEPGEEVTIKTLLYVMEKPSCVGGLGGGGG